ncbi:MAG: hypothetical protein WEF50_04505 [Myxococcota bacterium]
MAEPDADPWADTANRVREEVVRRPYVALLVGGGIGGLLAGVVVPRTLPGALSLGLRLALASTLPTLTKLVREVASPEL